MYSARIDGLLSRDETPKEITETFVGRQDLLCYRHATFKERVKKFGPQGNNARVIAVSASPAGARRQNNVVTTSF